jgi:ferredoxin-NADP reductase
MMFCVHDFFFVFSFSGQTDEYRKPARKLGMIAGGTGITPILQVIRHIRDKEKGAHIEM